MRRVLISSTAAKADRETASVEIRASLDQTRNIGRLRDALFEEQERGLIRFLHFSFGAFRYFRSSGLLQN